MLRGPRFFTAAASLAAQFLEEESHREAPVAKVMCAVCSYDDEPDCPLDAVVFLDTCGHTVCFDCLKVQVPPSPAHHLVSTSDGYSHEMSTTCAVCTRTGKEQPDISPFLIHAKVCTGRKGWCCVYPSDNGVLQGTAKAEFEDAGRIPHCPALSGDKRCDHVFTEQEMDQVRPVSPVDPRSALC